MQNDFRQCSISGSTTTSCFRKTTFKIGPALIRPRSSLLTDSRYTQEESVIVQQQGAIGGPQRKDKALGPGQFIDDEAKPGSFQSSYMVTGASPGSGLVFGFQVASPRPVRPGRKPAAVFLSLCSNTPCVLPCLLSEPDEAGYVITEPRNIALLR